MGADRDPWQVFESRSIGGHDFSLGRFRCGGDDQVMCAAWPSLPTHRNEKLSVRCGDSCVVVDDWDHGSDVVHELLTTPTVALIGQVDADQKLSDGYRSDGHLVVVPDQGI